MRDSNLLDMLLWIMRLRVRFRITGASMLPLLQPGDEVLVDIRAYRHHGPQVGDVVMVQHPHQPESKMVKRVTAVLPDDTYHIEGDNLEHSTDSRTFGSFHRQYILGRVTSLFG